jgi:hypothetical protein
MPAYRRLFNYAKDPDFIKGLRLKVDNALSLFKVYNFCLRYATTVLSLLSQLGHSMTAAYCIPNILKELKDLNLEEHLARVQERFADKIGVSSRPRYPPNIRTDIPWSQ